MPHHLPRWRNLQPLPGHP